MAFNVSIKSPEHELGRKNVAFEVHEDGEKIGELRISKGAPAWFPRNSKKRGYKVSWRKLAEFMEENGVTRETR
ncbi:hypothetical protein [uncultured Desulfovibrio sp.]|uniref:hypothetical protein n=1 Tax=uncultured Desulfovibrio sp. TaxID=167968 RepID=UPI00262EE97C|nr:hypothetical protein [uncultured Desulfovibrio sp.]